METDKYGEFSVEEAKNLLYGEVGSVLGWKFLKSKNSYKKVIGDLVLEVMFFSSKWNESYHSVEVQCEFRMWCKKWGKTSNVNSSVGFLSLNPQDKSWWNISTANEFNKTSEQICKRITEKIIPVAEKFETDFPAAVNDLAGEPMFSEYHLRIEFIDLYAGRAKALEVSKNLFRTLSDREKNEIEQYRQGARDKMWMINPSNLRYMADHDLL